MKIELIKYVLGSYRAIGSHLDDMFALENLDTVDELLLLIIDQLCKNVKAGENTSAYSVVDIGKKSNEILIKIKKQIRKNKIKQKEKSK